MEPTRSLHEFSASLRKKGLRLYGLLGDFDGNVEISGKAGWYYVRIQQAGSSRYSIGEFPGNVRPLYNLPVVIEQDPITGEQRIAGTDETMLQYGIDAGNDGPPAPGMIPHGDYHGWGGDDQVSWIHTLQIFPLRVQPSASTKTVVIQGGAYYTDGSYCWKSDASELDLSAYWPTSGTKWILIHIDADGALDVVDNGATTLALLDPAPPGAYALAAVRLRAVVSLVAWTDIADVRFTDGATAGNRAHELTQMLAKIESENDLVLTRHIVEG